jgi:hypothetical protein
VEGRRVDVVVNSERFVGARAMWRAANLSEIVVASASGEAVGLSAIAGLLDPVERSAPHGLHVRLVPPEEAATILTVPLAPGLMAPVGVSGARRLQPGESVGIEPKVGSLALDGEREIELGPRTEIEVRLDRNGPLTIIVGEVMREAVQRGLLNGMPAADST